MDCKNKKVSIRGVSKSEIKDDRVKLLNVRQADSMSEKIKKKMRRHLW